jgi:hypothetical protein
MLLQVPINPPKIKTNRYYKYYKNHEAYFDVFYNKDVAIIESTSITVFTYENTIVFSDQDYLAEKALRDFVITYRVKPHNINKENATQHKINNIIEGLKKLIKELEEEYEDFAYTYKPFTVCFVQLYPDNHGKPFIRYYEFSHETMSWISAGIKNLDPFCNDFKEIINGNFILDRYYMIQGYNEKYVMGLYKYKKYQYGLTYIYDLLTGKLIYSATTTEQEIEENETVLCKLTLSKRTIMFIGTSSYIIPTSQYDKDTASMEINNITLKFDGQEITALFHISDYNEDRGVISYILRNLQATQVFFIYDNYVALWEKVSGTSRFISRESPLKPKGYKLRHNLLHVENFFVVLFEYTSSEQLHALCLYYDIKNDLYKYALLELTELVSNAKAIREARAVGRVIDVNNNYDCIGLVISMGVHQIITILYNKNTAQFSAEAISSYDKILIIPDAKIVWNMTGYVVAKNKLYNTKIEINDYQTTKNFFYKLYSSHALNFDYVIFNTKDEKKICVFYDMPFNLKNSTGLSIAPDTYHNLGYSINKCLFECVEPMLVYSYGNE